MFKYNKEISLDGTKRTSHSIIASFVSQGETVLEFGCAKGELSAYIKENLGCKTYGIDISEVAISAAKEHLDGFICCDIENYEWEKELYGIRFDTLIFADVLEHLKNPAEAVRRALELLKDDGKILFSVPNIAHADIILKLLNNRFDYTDIGLLDDTHLRFFTKESIEDFCLKSGIFPVVIQNTVCKAGATEQRLTDTTLPLFSRAVQEKELFDTYQFAVYAVKSDFARENAIKTVWELDSEAPRSTVYFDFGEGFCEECSVSVDSPDGECSFSVAIPDGVKRIRLDLREEAGYAVSELSCSADEEPLSPYGYHNVFSTGSKLFMLKRDPQIFFDAPSGAKELCVKANIINMLTDTDIMNIPCELASGYESALDELDFTHREALALNERLTVLEDSETELTLKLDDATKRILELDSELESALSQLEHYKTHYLVAISQREDLKRQLADITMRYDVISKSQFWRATKPARATLDVIKYPFKHGPFVKVRKFFKVWREQGFKAAWKKVFRRKSAKRALSPIYTAKELDAQRRERFERDIKFSITVPLFNTPEKYLREMIESVLNQTYKNWELCLADGSDEKHAYVGETVLKYAKKDSRILYKKLEKNLGISGNTNACLEMSSGDYISLFDHDDLLHPAALYDVMKAICSENADFIYTDENTFHVTPSDAYCPHFKPDFSPDTLRSYNYICHFTSFSRELLSRVGNFRSEFDGSQDYDMILRLTEQAEKIVHIPKILYYWRCHKSSVASDISAKPYTVDAAKRALDAHLARVGLKGKALDSRIPSTYKIKYEIENEPLVSIIIANKDFVSDLDTCIRSVVEKSTYKNYEIIVVENNSTEKETFEYYKAVSEKYQQVRIVYWEGKGFNYSAINNFGFEHAQGDYIILLNNDIEIITPSWIEEMLMFAQRGDVGAVGAMLYYPDDTVQHAGVIIGIGADRDFAVAGHSHKYFKRGEYGYSSRLTIAQNLSAVTAACVMIRSDVYKEVGGLDTSYAVAFNDVDLCLKIRKQGYLIVWTPYAEAYHHESKSRGLETTPEKIERFNREIDNFLKKWRSVRDAGDPYYNPNLTLEKEDFSIR